MTLEDDGDEWEDGTPGREWRAGEPPREPGDAEDEPRELGLDPDHAAAVRTLRLVAAAGVLLVLAVVATFLARALDGDADAEDPTLDAAAGAAAGGIGPTPGTAVGTYVEGRRSALAEAEGTRVAVVSLTSYRPETGAADLVAAVGGIDVVAHLAAVPGGAPVAVEGAISAWVADTRTALQAERDEIAALLPTIEDPADPFIAGYTEDLARLDAQLAALDPAGDLVFGLVVRGDAEALRRLAERPEVRLLDVGASDDVAALTAYRGLRPEEVDLAGTPATRPA